jgi:hypothetical protein
MAPTSYRYILCGIPLGALMFGIVGSWSRHTITVIASGVAVGGLLGYGLASGRISPFIGYAVFFGLLFCILGSGFDDYTGASASLGALVGPVFGWLCRSK